jgi:uncharacterized protein
MRLAEPLITGRAPISAYGRGGFRIGGKEHRGSILILPQGVYSWSAADAAAISPDLLSPVLEQGAPLGFLILGTGASQVFPSGELRERCADAGLGLDAMDTGAACRTYNVLLAEERVFAAALIAIG